MKTSNTFALVTGASSGIGLEIARSLAKRGYNIILTARSEDKLKAIAKEISDNFKVKTSVFPSDLSDKTAPNKIFKFCELNKYDVSVLVNNAGFANPDKFHRTSMEDEERFIRVLGTSVIALTKLFLNEMLDKRHGRIMIVSSVAAYAPPSVIQSLYGPIKTFMNRFSDSININYKRKGISSTSVCPGYTVTEFHSASGTQEQMDKVPAFMKLTAERVAREGLDAMFAGKRLSIPSKRYKVLVFLMTYFSFLINIFSNALTGGRYEKK